MAISKLICTVNPCNICIVNAMCQDPCEELNEYIEKNLPSTHNYWGSTVAQDLRDGKCEFCYLGYTILKVIYYE